MTMQVKTVLFLFIVFCCSSGCRQQQRSLFHVFRYNESKGIPSLDPAYARNQTIIWPVHQIFNGLVQLNDSLRVEPAIASSWEISENGRVYTFFLRDDVWFHPSPYFKDTTRKVTAEDFVYSFRRILDPDIASPGSWIFSHVDPDRGFAALDAHTLRIWLKEPFPPFLSILTMPYCSVVPGEVTEALGDDFGSAPVGTGPFLFRYWNRDEMLVLVKNPAYFETDSQGNSLPYLDAVNISFIKDKQSEFLEFMKGNLDFLSGVHPAYKDELLTRSGTLNPEYRDRFRLVTQPYLNTEYLGFLLDTTRLEADHPLLDIQVRKAINYGFDRSRMMKYLRNNLGYPATAGFIPLGLEGGLSPGQGYTYRPDHARRLMEEAGYGEGQEMPEITLTTTSDYLDLCEYIQYELQAIGINLQIEVATGASFRNMVANSNLPFFRGSWIADYADAENYLSLFYSENFSPAGPNYTHFRSAEYDRLYRMSRSEPDREERLRLYRKMDSIIVKAAPVVPLYYDVVVRFSPLEIRGLGSNPMNLLVLKSVYRESHGQGPEPR